MARNYLSENGIHRTFTNGPETSGTETQRIAMDLVTGLNKDYPRLHKYLKENKIDTVEFAADNNNWGTVVDGKSQTNDFNYICFMKEHNGTIFWNLVCLLDSKANGNAVIKISNYKNGAEYTVSTESTTFNLIELYGTAIAKKYGMKEFYCGNQELLPIEHIPKTGSRKEKYKNEELIQSAIFLTLNNIDNAMRLLDNLKIDKKLPVNYRDVQRNVRLLDVSVLRNIESYISTTGNALEINMQLLFEYRKDTEKEEERGRLDVNQTRRSGADDNYEFVVHIRCGLNGVTDRSYDLSFDEEDKNRFFGKMQPIFTIQAVQRLDKNQRVSNKICDVPTLLMGYTSAISALMNDNQWMKVMLAEFYPDPMMVGALLSPDKQKARYKTLRENKITRITDKVDMDLAVKVVSAFYSNIRIFIGSELNDVDDALLNLYKYHDTMYNMTMISFFGKNNPELMTMLTTYGGDKNNKKIPVNLLGYAVTDEGKIPLSTYYSMPVAIQDFAKGEIDDRRFAKLSRLFTATDTYTAQKRLAAVAQNDEIFVTGSCAKMQIRPEAVAKLENSSEQYSRGGRGVSNILFNNIEY